MLLGNINAMIGLSHDNTNVGALFSNPEFLPALLDNMPLGFLYLSIIRDSAGESVDIKIESANKNFEKYIGRDHLEGYSATEVIGRESKHLLKVCRDVVKSGGKLEIDDFLFANSVKLSAVVYMPIEDEFACFISPNEGILRQTSAEFENNPLFSEPQDLLRVNADIQFLLRTHLNAILGFSELILEDTDKKNRDRYMEIIKENVQALMDSTVIKGNSGGTMSSEQTISQHGGSRPRILVAEDTESNFMLVSYILKSEYDLTWAKDGVEAVEFFEKEHPDLILMDVRMPRMSGLAATERIREVDKSVPIIALTAFAFESDKAKTMEAGCTDFIAKPINAMALKEIVKRHLR